MTDDRKRIQRLSKEIMSVELLAPKTIEAAKTVAEWLAEKRDEWKRITGKDWPTTKEKGSK